MTNYNDMPDTARVWIYQAQKPFSSSTVEALKPQIEEFVRVWTSHNNALKAWGDIYHNQFIVLMVDESQAGASGCSIDKSVAFVKHIEQATGIDLFDRLTFTYLEGEAVKSAHKDVFEELYQKGQIGDQTLVFNNLVKTKAEFENNWTVALGESWHKNFV
jgi:hypothetical protein